MRVLMRLIRSGLRVEDLLLNLLSTLKQIRDQLLQQVSVQQTEEIWLNNKEVMVRLHISARTFYRLKKNGKLIPYRMGGRDYYRQSEVDCCYRH